MLKFLIAGVAVAAGFAYPPRPEKPVEPDVQPLTVIPYKASWKCEDCTPEEQYVLEQLQEHTKISDRNALATVMGNIK